MVKTVGQDGAPEILKIRLIKSAQEKTARVVCDTRITACSDCEAIPRVMACIELWHASNYSNHRVTARTELLLRMPRFTLECSGLEHVARHRPQKTTYTCKNCDIFNILVCGMLRKC